MDYTTKAIRFQHSASQAIESRNDDERVLAARIQAAAADIFDTVSGSPDRPTLTLTGALLALVREEIERAVAAAKAQAAQEYDSKARGLHAQLTREIDGWLSTGRYGR